MRTLVYDLLLTEIWKEKVYHQIKERIPHELSIKQYMAVSHTSYLLCIDLPRSLNYEFLRGPSVSQDCL